MSSLIIVEMMHVMSGISICELVKRLPKHLVGRILLSRQI